MTFPHSYTVILVRPKYPRNIGMVARAMSNFGHQRLILIDPQCELDANASQGAAQGQQPLRECVSYRSWEHYAEHEGDGPRIAFSRREGKRRAVATMQELHQWPALRDGRPVSLMFGAEDHGLSRADLLWAHQTCALTIPGPLKSLNLSHAVLLVLSQMPTGSQALPEPAAASSAQSIDAPLRLWLETLNFDLSKKNWNAFFALRKMLMKAAPTEPEARLFTSVVHQTVHRIRQPAKAQDSCPER
jgi:tRNA/rRNA methyltransferase